MASPQENREGNRKTAGSTTKGMKRCPFCGAKNKQSFEYCVRCSEPLDESFFEEERARSRATLGKLVAGALVTMVALGLVAALRALVREEAPVAPIAASAPTPRPAEPAPGAEPILENVDSRELVASFNEGLAAYNRGEFATAARLFQEVLRDLPENPQAHQYLGLAYYQLGDYEDAADALESARTLRPDSFELLDHFVTACKKGGDLERASQALGDYVDRNPTAVQARLELARVARSMGNAEQAVAQAEALAEIEDPEFAYEYGVSLKEAGRYQEAKAALEGAIELNPDSAVAHHALGVTELLAGSAQRALAPLQAAVAREPDNGEFHFSLAQAYEKLDKIPESLAAYEKYIEHAKPDDPKASVVRERLEIAKKALAKREAAKRDKGGSL